MRVGFVGAVAALLVLVLPVVAGAHAVLLETTPVDRSTVAVAPTEVVLRFDEPVEITPASLRVYDGAARRVDSGDVSQPEPGVVEVTLPVQLPDGPYVVAWTVVSADGHPVRGGFVFSVGDEEGFVDDSVVAELIGAGVDPRVGAAAWATRAITYLATLVAVGGLALSLLSAELSGPRTTRLIRAAAVVGVAGSAMGVPLVGLEVTGLGPRSVFSGPVLAAGLGTSVGLAALLRVVALVAVAAMASRPRRWWGVAVMAAAVAAELVTGHTRTAQPTWAVVAADAVHVLAAMVWVGGLASVVVGEGRDPDGRLRVEPMRRYADIALRAVVLLVLSGLAMSVIMVGSVGAALESGYGRTLIAKLVVVAAVLVLAFANRRALGRRETASTVSGRLEGSVRLELVGLAIVVAVTAALVNVAPPSTAAGPFTAYVPFGEHQLQVVVDPARAGENEIHLYVLTPGGLPALVTGAATLEMRLPLEDIGPIVRPLTVAGPGHYLHIGSELVIPGRWELTVRRQVSDFDEVVAVAEVEVGK